MPSKPSPKKSLAKRRRIAAAVTAPVPDRRALQAQILDLQAGCLLQAGHHAAAETLSWRALQLREDRP